MKHYQTIIMLIVTSFFFGCTISKLVSECNAYNIPSGANCVKIYSDIQPDSLYDILIETLYFEGCGIQHSSEKNYSITTDSKNLGESTYLRMRIIISEHENHSIVTINGDCSNRSQGSQWLEAKWGSPMFINRPGFAGIIIFAHKIPHSKIEYIVR